MDGTDICIYDYTGKGNYYFPPFWHTIEAYGLIICGIAFIACVVGYTYS